MNSSVRLDRETAVNVAICDRSLEKITGNPTGMSPIEVVHCTGASGSEGVHETTPELGTWITSKPVEMVRVGTERRMRVK